MPGVLAVKARVPSCIPAVVGLPRNHRAEPVKAGWAVIIGIQVAAALQAVIPGHARCRGQR